MKIYIFILISTLTIITAETFNTPWGMCNIYNEYSSIENTQLIKIINHKINKLDKLYGPIPVKKFDFYIYNKNNQYDLKINNQHWKWSLGITYKNDKIIIKDPQFSHIKFSKFKQVVEHELNHLMINRIDNNHDIPRWFKEGFAMLIANESSLSHKIKVIKHLNTETLYNLDDITTFRNFTQYEYSLAYAQSVLYAEAIQNLYGKDIFINIIENLKNNVNFNDAIYILTNKNIKELEISIQDFLKKKYRWIQLINFSDFLFSIMPLLLVLGFIIKSIKVKKIKKQWEIEEELEDLMSS